MITIKRIQLKFSQLLIQICLNVIRTYIFNKTDKVYLACAQCMFKTMSYSVNNISQ